MLIVKDNKKQPSKANNNKFNILCVYVYYKPREKFKEFKQQEIWNEVDQPDRRPFD